jgi:hypothetical protein
MSYVWIEKPERVSGSASTWMSDTLWMRGYTHVVCITYHPSNDIQSIMAHRKISSEDTQYHP